MAPASTTTCIEVGIVTIPMYRRGGWYAHPMSFLGPGEESVPFDVRPFDRSLVSGVTWTVVVRWAAKAVSLASMLYVVRILTPGDFGLVSMASIPIGLAQLIGDLGLQTVVVQNRTLSEDELASVATSALGVGALLTVLFIVLSRPIALYFREPAVAAVIVVLSLTFLADSIQVLPRALLQRDLEFRTLAWLHGLQVTIAALVLAGGATLSLGYWALVLNTLVSSGVITMVLYTLRPFRLAWPSEFGSVTGALVAGWRVTVSRIAWYGYSSLDSMLIGRVLGKDALGIFDSAKSFAALPEAEVTSMVSKVVPGVFSSVQNSLPALRRYFLLLTEAVSYLTLPASVGLALTAEEFVRLALGPQWEAVIVPLRILCLYIACSSSQMLLSHVLLWTGHLRVNMWVNLLSLVFLPACFYLGLTWGVPGVAWAWVFGFPLIVVLKIVLVSRILDVAPTAYLSALRPALIASLAMTSVVLLVRASLPISWSPQARLALQASTGAVTYILVLLGAFHHRVGTIYETIRVAARS